MKPKQPTINHKSQTNKQTNHIHIIIYCFIQILIVISLLSVFMMCAWTKSKLS